MITTCPDIPPSRTPYVIEESQINSVALSRYFLKPQPDGGEISIALRPREVVESSINPIFLSDDPQPAKSELALEIERASAALSNLGHDWDGEGSAPYEKETIRRAGALLRKLARCYIGIAEIPVPSIGPGPDGTIELFWRGESGRLLVNVPASDSEPVVLYGEHDRGTKAKESFELSRLDKVAAWLMILVGP